MSQGNATVKQVISGDTVVLIGVPRGGPPPEKQLTFASIIAPRVALKTLTKEMEDEPYGWTSREFLREKVIGKQVEFKVEYTQGGREHGWITLDGKSVGLLMLQKGLARLKSNRNPPSAHDYEELEKAETSAKDAKVGLWNDEPGSAQSTVREIKWSANDVRGVKSFVENHRDKKLKAIVEYVRDGGCVRVFFTDEMLYAPVLISGIQCDGFKRETNEEGEEIFAPEPFAVETKFFVEARLLNRNVEVRLEGADDYGNIYGSVYHPNGNIAHLLLKNGFAKIQDWSARFTESPVQLRESMKEAQNKQLRKWKMWQPVTLDGEKEYSAKVVEVASGDSMVVQLADRKERRVYLASIRCPRSGGRNKEDEPWSFEAKEFCRKKLVGKKVNVVLEYMREPLASLSGAPLPMCSDDQGRMHFVSIYFDSEKINISELLISNGLARTVPHRAEEERAEEFDVLQDLEKQAEEKQVGVFGPEKSVPKHRVNELLGSMNAQRARSFEAQLQPRPKLEGVVEYIFNAGRFKIRIPSENLAISFVLGGIRCPQTARPAMAGAKARVAEPFAEESVLYTRDILMQREVTIKVDVCDRGGNFIGTLWFGKQNFAEHLVELGFASTVGFSLASSPHKAAILAAESKAKNNKLNIWSLPGALENGIEQNEEKDVDETYPSVCITHINSILDFYIQDSSCAALNNVTKQLAAYEDNPADEYTAGGLPRKGEVVLAKFTQDDQWYRARVESKRDAATGDFHILYVDFGNSENIDCSRIRRCPMTLSLQTIPAQAKACGLSGVLQPPDMEDEAAQFLHIASEAKVMKCKVEKVDASRKRMVILTEQEAAADSHAASSINEILVRQGLARLDKKSTTKIFSRLQKEEEGARKAHLNVWRYGDVGDDDEDEEYPGFKPVQKKDAKRHENGAKKEAAKN